MAFTDLTNYSITNSMTKKANNQRKFIHKDKSVILEYYPGKVSIHLDPVKINTVNFLNDKSKEICMSAEEQSKVDNYKEVRIPTNSQKMTMFCAAFKKYQNISYTPDPKKRDIKEFEGIPVNEKLLDAYFSENHWWNNQRNVKNYCHNINNIKQLLVDKFPNKYDSNFAKTLSPEKLQDYWRHLISLGFTNKNGRWEKN